MENKDNFVEGLMIGGVIGVVVGLMMAPDSGKKTRDDLVRTVRDLQDKIGDSWGQWQEKVKTKKMAGKKRSVIDKQITRPKANTVRKKKISSIKKK